MAAWRRARSARGNTTVASNARAPQSSALLHARRHRAGRWRVAAVRRNGSDDRIAVHRNDQKCMCPAIDAIVIGNSRFVGLLAIIGVSAY